MHVLPGVKWGGTNLHPVPCPRQHRCSLDCGEQPKPSRLPPGTLDPCTFVRRPLQVVAAHKDFLARVLTGFLLSKRIIVLRKLIDLKALAADFSKLSERLRIDTGAFEVEPTDPATGVLPYTLNPGAH